LLKRKQEELLGKLLQLPEHKLRHKQKLRLKPREEEEKQLKSK